MGDGADEEAFEGDADEGCEGVGEEGGEGFGVVEDEGGDAVFAFYFCMLAGSSLPGVRMVWGMGLRTYDSLDPYCLCGCRTRRGREAACEDGSAGSGAVDLDVHVEGVS